MKETVAGQSQACADGSHGSHAGHDHHPDGLDGDASELRARQRDPVCGMLVDPRTTPYRQQYARRLYFFCSTGCQSKFLDNPTKYLARS